MSWYKLISSLLEEKVKIVIQVFGSLVELDVMCLVGTSFEARFHVSEGSLVKYRKA